MTSIAGYSLGRWRLWRRDPVHELIQLPLEPREASIQLG
jgi:hypothetical protein